MCVWALTNPGPVMAWPSSSPWLRTRSSPRLPRRRSAYLPHRHVLRGRRILHGKPGAAHAVEARGRRGDERVRSHGDEEGHAMTGPGFVNAHTHIYSGLAPFDMPPPARDPENFFEILERVWWRLDRALDVTSLHAAARWYVADALLHGTTTLIDHHESPNLIEGSLDVIADACASLGMRALLCYGATERNRGRAEARRGLAECERFILNNRRPHVRGLVGLHASFTVSHETLEEAADMCARLETACHVHVAEDLTDVEDATRRGARGPLGRMFNAGTLPPRSILAHGVHLDASQVRDADANRLWLVQNPRSNEANRVGYPLALAASGRVALGTDGFPSDLRAERAALARLAAVHEPGTPAAALDL